MVCCWRLTDFCLCENCPSDINRESKFISWDSVYFDRLACLLTASRYCNKYTVDVLLCLKHMLCWVLCRKIGCVRPPTTKIFQIMACSNFFVSFGIRIGFLQGQIAKEFAEISKILIIFFNCLKTWEENALYCFASKIALHLKIWLQNFAMKSLIITLACLPNSKFWNVHENLASIWRESRDVFRVIFVRKWVCSVALTAQKF